MPIILLWSLVACTPSAPDVAISPRPASSSADLVVTPDPPEGETWSYRWARDGEVQSDLVSNWVPSERTAFGERWKVSVERQVGRRTSATGSASVRIDNGLPSVQAAIVKGIDGLEAVVWADDPDGDPVTVDWSWELDDDAVQDGGVLSHALLVQGDEWTLRAWGSDAEGRGPDATATYVVGNQPPRILGGSILPSSPTSSDALSVQVDSIDPEGDPLTVSVEWRADGTVFATGSPLAGGAAPVGPWIDAVVTVTDGQASSEPAVLDGLRLGNTPPTIASVSVEPAPLAFGVGPSCVVDGWSDPDGDPQAVELRWFFDGVLWEGGGSPSGTEMVKGQTVQCEATPVDSESAGPPVLSDPVPVVNSPPSIARVFIEPDPVRTGDVITAAFETVYDPDGDLVELEVTWFLDGLEVASGDFTDATPGAEVFPGTAGRTSVVEVVVVPKDDESKGIEVWDTDTVANGWPVVMGVTFLPNPPVAGSDLTVIPQISDPEGDPVDFSLTWRIDGSAPTEIDVLPGAQVVSGASIEVLVVPNDGFDNGLNFVEDVLVP